MKILKKLSIAFVALVLFACGDPRADDKKVFAEFIGNEKRLDSKELSECIANSMSESLNDEIWTAIMYVANNDLEGYDAYMDENNFDERTFESALDEAYDKAENDCTS